ncbi:MAG TPA: histidine--tRNA ligase [Acidimicrobiales bacterium]|nr:histidine--tRNA ligase [Acidimicrobiales bacterium]
MAGQYKAPKGTFDVLGPESARYEALIALFATMAHRYGFELLVQPMFEDVGVFQRIGGSTDVVRKEMYDFEDKGGRHIALRPEGTAQAARAYLEYHPTPPWKVWYTGPKFRYDRPQKGRYRQHHEVGVEAIGTSDADVDVEVISLACDFYAALGLTRLKLRLTSLGDSVCRPAYRAELEAFLEARRDQLCPEHRDRISENPMRVLDCKRDDCIAATKDAPHMVDRLCEPCTEHFARVRAGLDAAGIAYVLDPSLVRGLDYYTRTTFEFEAEALESAQNAAGGGGRYDGLIEQLGGQPTPGIGFGLGIERILIACDAEGAFATPTERLDVFVIDTTGGDAARDIARELRLAGLRVDRAFDNRSFKSQMTAALRSGARLAIVVEDTGITIRTLMQKGEPVSVERANLVASLNERLSS